MCRLHAAKRHNVQDVRIKLTQKFAHPDTLGTWSHQMPLSSKPRDVLTR